MNPLTAIRSWTPPELNAAAIPNGVLNGSGANVLPQVNIPPQELQALKPMELNSVTRGSTADGSLGQMFGQLLTDVVAKQNEAGRTVSGVLSSQGVPLHQAMIAMQEANISFQLMLEVRNKLLESYQELMRMQI
ncbi:MAG: flagellar hook-basal body complex protein FliE [Verrucomicrobia bacterium]|nr:flagellar hook-basal body complex protein FliE [Verrucomicrobiota bacterium]